MAEGGSTIAKRIRNVIAHDVTLLIAKISLQGLNGGKHFYVRNANGFFSSFGKYLSNASGAVGALGENMGTLLGLGAVGAIGAAVTQMDYRHQVHELLSVYRDELAAKLKKSPQSVTEKDLDIVAKGDPSRGIEANKTIADILHKHRRARTIGVALSVIASIATFAILQIASAAAGLHAIGLAATVAEGFVGVATYKMIKAPLEWAAHHQQGLHHKTTHERICQLHCDHEDGKIISQEQVLDVFVSANAQLDRLIVQKYGAPLERLPLAKKDQAVQEIGKLVPLRELTDNINSGQYKAAELAFAVEGQVSGANHQRTVERVGLLEGMIQSMRNMGRARHNAVDTQALHESPTVSEPKHSFVERLGLAKAHTHLGHVEQLNQERTGTTVAQR